MLATRVGYAGGELAEPSYHEIGDHMEAVEVTFDPERVSYDELLDVFWGMFPANIPPGPSRVRTAVLTSGETQREAAAASKRRLRRALKDRIYTDVRAGAEFWPAERMHQKFHLQRVYPDLVEELARGDVDAFLASTAASRLNAWVSGFADDAALEEAARELGWEVDALRARLQTAS